jgi:hypothetical protein
MQRRDSASNDDVSRAASGTIERIRQEPVTLVVEEWRGVQPGRLAWVFPDFATAREAARAMRNAARWVILAGRSSDIARARSEGLVLAESDAA